MGSKCRRMASFLSLFLSILSIFVVNGGMVNADTDFESDIGNLFEENNNDDTKGSAVWIIVIAFVMASICIVTLCCVQFRRCKLKSQQTEATLGGPIQSFAYSDDGDE